MSKRTVTQPGFTLVEVLIALAITAFVSIISYSSLSTVISGVESTRATAETTYELNRAFMIISRDLRQYVNRPVWDEYGEREPAMTGGPLARSMLSFTRSGWSNPNDHLRSTLQRVNYLVEDEALWRESYSVLDRVADSKPQRVKLLDNVEELSVVFLSSVQAAQTSNAGKQLDTKNWLDNWVANTSNPSAQLLPPAAIELRLQLEEWGEIRRLYDLPPN